MLRLLIAAAAVGLVLWIGLVIYVTVEEQRLKNAPIGETQAIIVLGAQVKADGSLSVQLQWRLDKALEVYSEHPQPIVVCGARGRNEPVAEAQAMRDYLEENGVPAEDILLDDTSFNTRQNLCNAKKLLGKETNSVLIVTSDYHLPRAMALGADIGFEASGAGSPIKLIYWPKNHFREALAWVKYWMQKIGILPY